MHETTLAQEPRPSPPAANKRQQWLLTLLCIAIPLGFLVAGLIGAYPFVDDVRIVGGDGDDWETYKRNALSIVHDGPAMLRVNDVYRLPAGFLYNYFVALVFATIGENSSYVYVVQSLLLGLTVVVTYLAFRPYLSREAGILLLVLLVAYLVVDLFRQYTFRLLSENLALFLGPLGLFLVLRSNEQRRGWLALAGGVVMGLAVLTRPHMMPVAGAMLVVWLAYALGSGNLATLRLPALFLLGIAVAYLILPLRNYAAVGDPNPLSMLEVPARFNFSVNPLDRIAETEGSRVQAVLTVLYGYLRRAVFVAGYLPIMEDTLRIRPHWMVMWAGVLAALVAAAFQRRMPFWEALGLSYVLTLAAGLVAVGLIWNYGYRMVVPVIPIAVAMSCRGLDVTALAYFRARHSQAARGRPGNAPAPSPLP